MEKLLLRSAYLYRVRNKNEVGSPGSEQRGPPGRNQAFHPTACCRRTPRSVRFLNAKDIHQAGRTGARTWESKNLLTGAWDSLFLFNPTILGRNRTSTVRKCRPKPWPNTDLASERSKFLHETKFSSLAGLGPKALVGSHDSTEP